MKGYLLEILYTLSALSPHDINAKITKQSKITIFLIFAIYLYSISVNSCKY